MITGVVGYEMTVMLDLMPMNPGLGILILVSGITSGIVGAYLSLVLWKRISQKRWIITFKD